MSQVFIILKANLQHLNDEWDLILLLLILMIKGGQLLEGFLLDFVNLA